MGGIAGAALLAAFILWFLRRRRQRAQRRPTPFADKEEAFGMPEPDISMPMGKYYVRPTSCCAGTALSLFFVFPRPFRGCLP